MLIEKDRWKNRRRMTWIAVIAGVLYPLLILYTESEQLGQIAVPFYLFISSIVAAYFSFATVDDKWSAEAKPKEES
jgi:hypothetical protein